VTHETVLSITYATPERARRVERSIAPEIGDIDDDRSRTRLARDDDELSVTVQASDVVALRAAINTWLSLVSVAEDVGGV
jgi:KEOPS complex subunit Pcc1